MARRKGKAEAPHENEERWLLTYADMITLLMVLFVVMYAISNTDIRKFTVLAQSMAAAFNVDVLQGTQAVTITAGQETTPDTGQMSSGSGVVSSDFRSIEAGLKDWAIQHGLSESVEVTRSREGIVIRIGGSLLFESGRVVLNADSEKLLDKVVSLIKPLPNKIRIEGHTDDVAPDSWLYRDNWQLSSARSLAVLDAMRARGIDEYRLSAEAFAQYEPIEPNTDDASRARNRRVDLVVLYPDESENLTSASPTPSLVQP
jgi:chemotaxis protein MotB